MAHSRRQAARDKILDAAANVFAEQGLAGARVDEIARQAGVNKAMLYYHVGDKNALYQAVLQRNFDLLFERIHETLRDKKTPEAKLEGFIEAIVAVVEKMASHPRIMMRELASGGPNVTPEVFTKLVAIFDLLRVILDDGIAAGRFRQTHPLLTHISIVASVMMTATVKPMLERLADKLPAEVRTALGWNDVQVVENITTLLLHGLDRGGPK